MVEDGIDFMALGPEAREQRLMEQVEDLERRIDEMIAQSDRSGDVLFPLDDVLCDTWVMNHIIMRYKKAGWKTVERREIQRDGTYLILGE